MNEPVLSIPRFGVVGLFGQQVPVEYQDHAPSPVTGRDWQICRF